jgi:F0F1-type ATP synthase delta subunit
MNNRIKTIMPKNDNEYESIGSLLSMLVLRDSQEIEPSIQQKYFNDVAGMFLRRFAKMYGNDELSDDERARMRRYLERVFDAKDAVTPREPKGGMYLRSADR